MKRMDRKEAAKYLVIGLMIGGISAFHYTTSIDHRYLHEIYQRAYYIPILLAAYWFGPWKGLLFAFVTSMVYAYHIQRDWTHVPVYSFNQYAEIILYHLTALIIGFLALKDRRQREKLEAASQELTAAYEKLQDTFEQLRRADRLAALGELSAGIAHEIRNPLGSIKGSVEILENEIPPDHPKREFVRILKEETARLNSIIAQFLKFARPPRPSVEPTDIAALIDETLILVEKEAEQGAIDIRRNLDSSIPQIKVDQDQMRQVLLNLLLNGIQAMPEGGALQVRSFQSDGRLVIEVEDEGTGISKEIELDQIFDPFFTTKSQGTGLGLSISHQLIENHNGTLTAHRNRLKGLTLRVELPLESLPRVQARGKPRRDSVVSNLRSP